jgi:hypothetical protein
MADTVVKKKRKASTSPTKRGLADLRKMGFLCHVTERWNAFAHIRQDMFGVIDIVAVREGVGILGVQVTSDAHHSERRLKSIAEPRLRTWLLSGGRFEVWSYGLKGARDTRKLYQLRREEITLADLPPMPPDVVVTPNVEGRRS